jgi:hypothetical protein
MTIYICLNQGFICLLNIVLNGNVPQSSADLPAASLWQAGKKQSSKEKVSLKLFALKKLTRQAITDGCLYILIQHLKLKINPLV